MLLSPVTVAVLLLPSVALAVLLVPLTNALLWSPVAVAVLPAPWRSPPNPARPRSRSWSVPFCTRTTPLVDTLIFCPLP